MHQIHCVCNGNKKINRQNQRTLVQLQSQFGDRFNCYFSPTPADAKAYIHALDAACTHLLCIGGDGTFNTLINAVCTHPNTGFQPILGVIPNGTGNDFFRSAGFEKNTDFAALIQGGGYEKFDVGLIDTEVEKRYFTNIADVGFGGAVVLELQRFRKNFGPNFSYGLAIIQTFLKYKRPSITIQSENYSYTGELLLAAFCNGSIFGDGLYIHPEAKINDGLLKLTLLGKVSLFDYIKNVSGVKRGLKIKHPEAFYINCSFPLTLKCELQSLHAETDGEYISGHCFKIDLCPGKLKLLAASKD